MSSYRTLQESVEVCVGYLCTRLEEIEGAVKSGRVHLTETGVKALVEIGRNLNAIAQNIATEGAQDIVVQFTDSESKPQDMGDSTIRRETLRIVENDK